MEGEQTRTYQRRRRRLLPCFRDFFPAICYRTAPQKRWRELLVTLFNPIISGAGGCEINGAGGFTFLADAAGYFCDSSVKITWRIEQLPFSVGNEGEMGSVPIAQMGEKKRNVALAGGKTRSSPFTQVRKEHNWVGNLDSAALQWKLEASASPPRERDTRSKKARKPSGLHPTCIHARDAITGMIARVLHLRQRVVLGLELQQLRQQLPLRQHQVQGGFVIQRRRSSLSIGRRSRAAGLHQKHAVTLQFDAESNNQSTNAQEATAAKQNGERDACYHHQHSRPSQRHSRGRRSAARERVRQCGDARAPGGRRCQ